MQFQNNPFGQLPQFGGMAGPGGFAGGMMPGFGGGMFGAPPEDDEEKKKHGMNPLMMLSPLAAALGSGHPNIGLGMISPILGGMRALGLFK